MTFRKYLIYMDDGQDCFKAPVPAENEQAARRYVNGNGEVIAVKDITDDCPISSNKVSTALRNAGFGQTEIMLIIRALEETDICNPLY